MGGKEGGGKEGEEGYDWADLGEGGMDGYVFARGHDLIWSDLVCFTILFRLSFISSALCM